MLSWLFQMLLESGLLLDFVDEVLDLVGVVDGADHAAELGEAAHLSDLDGAWFLSWPFEFDEADFSVGEDEESVWHSGGSWAGEFWGDSSCFFGFAYQCLFDCSFEHWCGSFLGWVDKVGVFST